MNQLSLLTRKGRGGRPTSYRPEYCRRVVELMAEGRSLEGCAALIGVHPDTLWEWHRVHPEFSEAVRAGRAASTTYWESRLLDVAQGGRGNAQAIQWALRNRSRAASGWHHDIQKIEHVGPEGGPVPPPQEERQINVGALTVKSAMN
jgi:transposase